MGPSGLTSLLWFAAIIAAIPVVLWLLKRTPMGGGTATQGGMRSVAVLPLSPNQRLVTVEVGQGEHRQWLVLGVTPGSITTLHTLPPQTDVPGAPLPVPPFAQMLSKLRREPGADHRGR